MGEGGGVLQISSHGDDGKFFFEFEIFDCGVFLGNVIIETEGVFGVSLVLLE